MLSNQEGTILQRLQRGIATVRHWDLLDKGIGEMAGSHLDDSAWLEEDPVKPPKSIKKSCGKPKNVDHFHSFSRETMTGWWFGTFFIFPNN
jgi:hypothetical protein